MAGCSNQSFINDKVSFPLKGLFHKDKDLIVKYRIDNITLNGYVEDIEAYGFEEDAFLKLKAYDITLKLPHLLKENQSHEIDIRYFYNGLRKPNKKMA